MPELLSAHKVSQVYRSFSLLGPRSEKVVLRDVDLSLPQGETLGLIGASGSGKSTLCRLLLGLERVSEGRVLFRGRDLAALNRDEVRDFRKSVQIVFQDSVAAVNPRFTVRSIVTEPMDYLTRLTKKQKDDRVDTLLNQVGLRPDDADKLPGRMSGGQLQRVCIARALASEPELIALDESLSSLDTVLQHQLIDLLASIQRERGTSFLFVTHDLRLVHRFCSRVVVLDGGRIEEVLPVVNPIPFQSTMGRALRDAILPQEPVKQTITEASGAVPVA